MVVHEYNATRHDSTGYSPFYLMFGRHPRLPIDIAMGIEPKEDLDVDYTRTLKERLDLAYKLALARSEKSSSRHKSHYDKRVRGSSVHIGDRVLVKNVTIRGKHKLANAWEDPVYEVVEQPNDDIPVFVVKREDGKGAKRTLHRNLLLPVNFLPLTTSIPRRTQRSSRKSVCTGQDQKTADQELRTEQASSTESSSEESEEEQTYYLRSRSRHHLNPEVEEFVPRAEPVLREEPVFEERVEFDVQHEQEPEVEAQEDVVPDPPVEVPVFSPRRSGRERRIPDRYGDAVSHQHQTMDSRMQQAWLFLAVLAKLLDV